MMSMRWLIHVHPIKNGTIFQFAHHHGLPIQFPMEFSILSGTTSWPDPFTSCGSSWWCSAPHTGGECRGPGGCRAQLLLGVL